MGEFFVEVPTHWGPPDLRGIVTLGEWRRMLFWLPAEDAADWLPGSVDPAYWYITVQSTTTGLANVFGGRRAWVTT